MGLVKRNYTDLETLITAENLNDMQDAILALEDGLFTIDNNKSGEVITITDAYKRGFRSLSIYGKTTQNGTPTPDSPVDLVSAGNSGSITVNVSGESETKGMTIATPNGLPGIPVTSGGNYTDANGQQWVCDEIDFGSGVYIQRCYAETIKTEWDTKNGRNVGVLSNPANLNFTVGSGIFILTDKLPFHSLAGAEGSQPDGVRISPSNKIAVIACYNNEVIAELNVIYPLETPIETPLSDAELAAYASLHTYRGNTTVSNDAGAWMDLEYVMDAKKYIDSLLAGVSSATILDATVE